MTSGDCAIVICQSSLFASLIRYYSLWTRRLAEVCRAPLVFPALSWQFFDKI
jgi:hypothetical protein